MNMNPMMMNMNMMNMMPMNVSIGDNQGWNLIFEEKQGNRRTIIRISPDKTVQEAINLYKIKTNKKNNENIKFIYNGKQLYPSLQLCQSGLSNNNVITVITLKEFIGGYLKIS